MAQTKTRSSRSSSPSRGGNKRSGSSSRKSSSSRPSSGGSSKRSSTSTQRSSPQAQKRSQSQNGSGKSTVGTIADKAKGPALAGGAALVGIAGGMALTRKRKRGVLDRLPTPKLSKLSTPKISLPKPDSVARAVGNAAGQVAERSQTVSQVAAQVQRASEAIDGRND
jgi:hypothetical protein